ncbi:heparinase II/III family protein [Sedimentitalea sp. XS_ASV28]|uniref:heparinase II/III family protein n=1 Tax=Sedimentitalea sp. XS_ASV28 TaxID=3241296 RepID=UPI00351397EF
MAGPHRLAARGLDRLHAWMARGHRGARGFVSDPEPRGFGSVTRGRQILAGRCLLAGQLVEIRGRDLWDVPATTTGFDAARHGFGWLDDLAAAGDARARSTAQDWLWNWIGRFEGGRGPGWTPALTGRRAIRWVNHAAFLLHGRGESDRDLFLRALSRQCWFLSRRAQSAAPGVPRFEALSGLIVAALSMEGRAALADPAVPLLARECDAQIDATGGMPTRNPEELLRVFTLLTWTAADLHRAGRAVPTGHSAAIARIAPTLRALRHADGGLARFHGGGRGLNGRLDHALAASGVKPRPIDARAMGYVRLAAGRTSVIVDAAPPPAGAAAFTGHASTLAFELTSGRRPMIVNCGSGAVFGDQWRRAGRATPSHSTLGLTGYSSARIATSGYETGRCALIDGPRNVPVEMTERPVGLLFWGGHDGYVAQFGLTHARRLDLSFDGRSLSGEDMLLAIDRAHKRRFDRALQQGPQTGIGFDVRWHLHPEVQARLDPAAAVVTMTLRSGESWEFRTDNGVHLSLQPGVYLDDTHLEPTRSRQIVVSAHAVGPETRIRWTLAKARDTAIAIRDLHQDDEPGDDV